MTAFGITAGEEAFRATALRLKFGTFSWRKLAVRKVKPRSTIRVDPLSTRTLSLKTVLTRIQAVARIADRTAKNCKRHVI